MIAFGGIWETWHDGDGDAATSAAITTTPANEPVSELHERMPLVIEQEHWADWLLGEAPDELLQPTADDVLTWHTVDLAIGNTRNDDPHLIEPNAQD